MGPKMPLGLPWPSEAVCLPPYTFLAGELKVELDNPYSLKCTHLLCLKD